MNGFVPRPQKLKCPKLAQNNDGKGYMAVGSSKGIYAPAPSS
ncbi:hypothetical protein [Campylobacter sp.]|nr:hypothetical protein [Campylobacter sp.]